MPSVSRIFTAQSTIHNPTNAQLHYPASTAILLKIALIQSRRSQQPHPNGKHYKIIAKKIREDHKRQARITHNQIAAFFAIDKIGQAEYAEDQAQENLGSVHSDKAIAEFILTIE